MYILKVRMLLSLASNIERDEWKLNASDHYHDEFRILHLFLSVSLSLAHRNTHIHLNIK